MYKKEKGKKRSWGLYVLAFCVPVIGLLVHMLIGKCYPFGDNSILLGDAKDQYLSFFKELYDRLKTASHCFLVGMVEWVMIFIAI